MQEKGGRIKPPVRKQESLRASSSGLGIQTDPHPGNLGPEKLRPQVPTLTAVGEPLHGTLSELNPFFPPLVAFGVSL